MRTSFLRFGLLYIYQFIPDIFLWQKNETYLSGNEHVFSFLNIDQITINQIIKCFNYSHRILNVRNLNHTTSKSRRKVHFLRILHFPCFLKMIVNYIPLWVKQILLFSCLCSSCYYWSFSPAYLSIRTWRISLWIFISYQEKTTRVMKTCHKFATLQFDEMYINVDNF